MKSGGFSLIELMVAVVVLGILAAVAFPSYNQYIAKSRRSDAKSALMAAAQGMERFYTENSTYNGAALGSSSTNVAATTSSGGYYTVAFDSAPTSSTVCGSTGTSNGSAGAYRLCATPTGVQANDSCSVFSLSQSGAKTPSTSGCW